MLKNKWFSFPSRSADPMDVAEPWNEQRTPERETTSSEDELLASQADREGKRFIGFKLNLIDFQLSKL
jgi:hypothetical protein